jgi:hypothetical protein
MRVWTVGHSTHTLDRFVALLTAHGIALVADIRAGPRSRRHPWFIPTPSRRACRTTVRRAVAQERRDRGTRSVEGNTLEWFMPSPPPEDNFDVIPRVRSSSR